MFKKNKKNKKNKSEQKGDDVNFTLTNQNSSMD